VGKQLHHIDVQNQKDFRKIPINKVGVKGLEYPITVLDKANGVQHTSAIVNLFVDLPHEFKGTHMSRFIEVFNKHRKDLSMPHFLTMLKEVRTALHAETAYADIHFPYFIEKEAPVSHQKSIMRYECAFQGMVNTNKHNFIVSISIPVQTVCPCSKAISKYGAHNQRGIVTVSLHLGPFFWIEDIIGLVESCASSAVFTLLKRSDEKFVTETAYENPRFVEDLVREVYLKLEALKQFPEFTVEAENFESIHNHSAFAMVHYQAHKE